MSNRFSLIDEPWIPVVNHGNVSLLEIFENKALPELGVNAVQKLALIKLLLAIGQTAYTPKTDREWSETGFEKFCDYCTEYLRSHHDLFWLYGSRPFLQMPILKEIKTNKGEAIPSVPIGRDYLPDLPSANDSILFETQKNKLLTDAEKALFIVTVMNYGLAGKRIVKGVPPISNEYKGKTDSAKGGPSVGSYVGYLNSFLLGSSIAETIWLNLFSEETLNNFHQWAGKPIIPPWQDMPQMEDDQAALRLKESFMSTLCSLSRFVLLTDDGIIYSEGLQYPSHKDGWREPFMTYNATGKIIWLNMDKKPWRELIALLSAAYSSGASDFSCPQIYLLWGRVRNENLSSFGIWSGGLKFRSNAGDSSVKQNDDFLESRVYFDPKSLGDTWFNELQQEMELLNKIANMLWHSVNGYFCMLKINNSLLLNGAVSEFWGLCELSFQNLVDSLEDTEKVKNMQKIFFRYAQSTYNKFCPKETPRQIEAWAKNQPNFALSLLNKKNKEAQSG